MTNADMNWIANYIRGICDDVLRNLYTRGKYRDVVLPMAVLRRRILPPMQIDGRYPPTQ